MVGNINHTRGPGMTIKQVGRASICWKKSASGLSSWLFSLRSNTNVAPGKTAAGIFFPVMIWNDMEQKSGSRDVDKIVR